MNYFSPRSAAERYARGRPYFHPFVIARVGASLGAEGPPPRRALDVGCGTGLSAVALAALAESVYGVDAAPEMISLAARAPRVSYVVAAAERLPFGAGVFDLLTLSQVFHWLDRGRFLAEARRVLVARGWLVVYDNYFSGRAEGDEEFRAWHRDSYLARYPSPPRGRVAFTGREAEEHGFRLLGGEVYPNAIGFTHGALVDFLLTQSNVIAAVEGGREEAGEARRWLSEGLAPFFAAGGEKSFLFDAPVWRLRRAD